MNILKSIFIITQIANNNNEKIKWHKYYFLLRGMANKKGTF